MSKMSKTIAVLGVVAGLGVAALPLSTYAADNDDTVTLNVAVSETLELDIAEASLDISSVNSNLLNESSAKGNQWNEATVTAKSSGSYNIAVKTSNTNLVNGSDTIPAGAPKTSGTVTASAWGLKNATTGTTTTNSAFSSYAALDTVGKNFVRTTSAPANADDGDTYKARFGVTTQTGQAAGTYTGDATFTLMGNI